MNTLFIAFVLGLPQPATSFNFEVDASPRSRYSIYFQSHALKANHTYLLKSFQGKGFLEVEVRWVQGNEVRRQTLILELKSGRHNVFEIQIPRVFPNVEKC